MSKFNDRNCFMHQINVINEKYSFESFFINIKYRNEQKIQMK